MADQLSESGIVREVADIAAERITRKVIKDLQRMKDTLSGDESGLATTWDEICVQVQRNHSFYWDAYDQTVRNFVEKYVNDLPQLEINAIWLQTEQGIDWKYEEPEDREPYPTCQDDVVDYITREHVYGEAGNWSNARIQAYLNPEF